MWRAVRLVALCGFITFVCQSNVPAIGARIVSDMRPGRSASEFFIKNVSISAARQLVSRLSGGCYIIPEMFRPIERDQDPAVQAFERIENAAGFDGVVKQRIERGRGDSIEHGTDMRIGWDFLNAKQGLAVRPSVPLRQPPLIIEKRSTAHEEQRERRQSDIRHRVFAGPPRGFAPVRKTGANLAQRRDQGFGGVHQSSGSDCQACRQAKSSLAERSSNEI